MDNLEEQVISQPLQEKVILMTLIGSAAREACSSNSELGNLLIICFKTEKTTKTYVAMAARRRSLLD
jgi:hypothetical protein